GGARIRQPRDPPAQVERRLAGGRAIGQQQKVQPRVNQRVNTAHAHPRIGAWLKREAPRLILRARDLDQHSIVAEWWRRSDRPYAVDRRQAQPQPLERADKGLLLDFSQAQRWAGQLLLQRRKRHILGPE